MFLGKYSIDKKRFCFDAPYIGFAQCCGVNPKVDFDSKNENAKYYVGHMGCPVCNNQIGVIANGDGELPERVGFLYNAWNRANPNKPLYNIPSGFKWGTLSVSYMPHGSTIEDSKYFIIYKIEGQIIYYYNFYTCEINQMNLPIGKAGVYFLENRGWCTDKSEWNTLTIGCFNYKWKQIIEKFFMVDLNEKIHRY